VSTLLTWCARQARLTESVPSSTASVADTSSDLSESHVHARALRGLLESFDDLRRSRTEIVERAQRLAEADDIQPRIMEAAAQFDQLVEMRPETLEDTTDEELEKYDKFLRDISESEEKQSDILTAIRVRVWFLIITTKWCVDIF
jgi:programmed cell death 6-interacting protein